MNEITLEITSLCPFECKYCSSNSTTDKLNASFLSLMQIKSRLKSIGNIHYDRIIISGGEPLLHPEIGEIILFCRTISDDVVIYSNLITHLVYNANVIDGVYLECNLSIPENVDKIHILKRVNQGREKMRPEVKLSKNFNSKGCNCNNIVLLSSGDFAPSACRKDIGE